MSKLLTVKDIAVQHSISKNTVRNWTRYFAAYLSTSATTIPRQYDEADVRILAIVAELRADNLSYAEIRAELDGQYITFDTADIGPTPTALTTEQDNAPAAIFNRLLFDLKASYESQVRQLVEDRSLLQQQLDEERTARIEAEKAAAAAEAVMRFAQPMAATAVRAGDSNSPSPEANVEVTVETAVDESTEATPETAETAEAAPRASERPDLSLGGWLWSGYMTWYRQRQRRKDQDS